MQNSRSAPLIDDFYRQYLVDQDDAALVERVSDRYTIGTLERIARHGLPLSRRAAVLVIGCIGDFTSNATLGRALVDEDRGVRALADSGIRSLWCRVGNVSQRKQLASVIRLNALGRHKQAVRLSTRLLGTSDVLAEAWNQRALAHFSLGQFESSLADCRQTLELNPYHFGAASGLGQCYLQIGDRPSALESFRRALRINPALEGVRAHILFLQQTLRSPEP